MRKLWLLALLALALLTAQNAHADDDAMWALLKTPGHVVLLRHSNAPGATPEPYGIDLKNCAIQRSLDDDGRAQARRVGDAFRKHGITRVRLLSSQFCRALETARLTKLGPVAGLPSAESGRSCRSQWHAGNLGQDRQIHEIHPRPSNSRCWSRM